MGALATLAAVPTIVSLRERIEMIRQGELERVLARYGETSPETRAALEAMSARIVNTILHGPLACLQAGTREGRGLELIASVRELFALERAAEPRDARATRVAPAQLPIGWRREPAS